MTSAQENMNKIVDDWVAMTQRAAAAYGREMKSMVGKLTADPVDMSWINDVLAMTQTAVNDYTNALTKFRSFAVAAQGLDPSVGAEPDGGDGDASR